MEKEKQIYYKQQCSVTYIDPKLSLVILPDVFI